MQRQGGLSVETMCELAQVARSGYYRFLRAQTSASADEDSQRTEPLYESEQQNPGL
jgi:hypothetical protein